MPFTKTGPLHARPYVDSDGVWWTFDATTLDEHGDACFVASDGRSVRGPNLAAESELDAWAARIEASL